MTKGGMEMRKIETVFIFGVVILMLVLGAISQFALAKSKPPPPPPPPQATEAFTMWINHLDFLSGDITKVTTSFSANSGVGGGLSGLIIKASKAGEGTVEKGLQVSPGFWISGVRVCYELSSSDSFISNISLAQLQNPPATVSVLLDDQTDLTGIGPICVDSAAPSTPIDPSLGAVRLSLGIKFGDTPGIIVVRAVGLHLVLDPNGPIEHTHIYLTGKGVGHNNTQAITSEPIFP
jgi:hypothetical protein